MFKYTTTAAGCAVLGLLIAGPASAACALSAQPIAVKIVASRPMVDVKVNGKIAHFVVDSGTAVNLINSKFAASQKLTPTKASDSGPAIVKAPQFEFAGASLKDVPLVASEVADADGVIGQTFLRTGDVEYDLLAFGPAAKPSVKLFKATGCEGVNMAYWAKEGDVFWEAPLTSADKANAFTATDVIVNGVKLRGIFSTGKPFTTITEKAAAKAGVKPGDPGVKVLGANAGEKSWMANFNSIIIGNEETKGEPLEIDQTNDDFYDVLIGEDFFASHHLYVANSQQKIYFTRSIPGPIFKVHAARPTALQNQGRLQDHFSPGNDN